MLEIVTHGVAPTQKPNKYADVDIDDKN